MRLCTAAITACLLPLACSDDAGPAGGGSELGSSGAADSALPNPGSTDGALDSASEAPGTEGTEGPEGTTATAATSTGANEGWPDAGCPTAEVAGLLFCDDFESGALDLNDNGISWFDSVNTAVTNDEAWSGSQAMRFRFKAAADPSNNAAPDAWAEQRVDLGSAYQDLWFHFRLFVPPNFEHKTQVDGPGNNKFLALYHRPYSRSGYSSNFSTWPEGDSGGSSICYTTYRFEDKQWNGFSECLAFIAPGETGWIDIVLHYAAPTTSAAADGVMQLWKNGESVIDATDVNAYGGDGTNFFDEAYVLGWANAGFAEETIMFVDDFAIAESNVFGM